MQSVVHVHNRTLRKSSQKDVRHMTPYEIMVGKKSILSHLLIFGSKVKALKPPKYLRVKMDSKNWNGLHVEYAQGDAYRC